MIFIFYSYLISSLPIQFAIVAKNGAPYEAVFCVRLNWPELALGVANVNITFQNIYNSLFHIRKRDSKVAQHFQRCANARPR